MNYTEIEIEGMKEILRDKEKEIKKLNEKIRFLEQCLDNKEKVNKSLREENKKLKGLLKEHITTYDVHFDELIEENRKLKLHIEAKDKAYVSLLKDYEEIKEDNKKLKTEIGEWLDAIRQKI